MTPRGRSGRPSRPRYRAPVDVRRLLAVPADRPVRRTVRLLVGLVLFGAAAAVLVRGGLGLDPWNVLGQGIARRSGLTLGTVTLALSFVVLALWIPLRQRPGLGTLANALIVGPVIDLGLRLVPPVAGPGPQLALVAVSIPLTAVATGLYVGAGLGPGPRDGLMTGLHRRFGVPIFAARFTVEAAVLLVGWLLGGAVGVATLLFAVLIGPLVHLALHRLAVPAAAGAAGDGDA